MRFHEFGVYEINMMLAAISVPNNVFDVRRFCGVAAGVAVFVPGSREALIFTAKD
jgi:hypothetical protein